MNYRNIYNNLISKGKIRERINILPKYFEKHHIRPKSLKGTEDPLNIVKLTAREHFIAHKLLYKIYPKNEKVIFTIYMMSNFNKKMTGKFYEELKIKRSKLISKKLKGRKHTEESKKKMSNAKKGRYLGKNNSFYGKGYKISGEKHPMYGKNWQDLVDEDTIRNHKINTSKNHSRHFLGKCHTDESKSKMRKKQKCKEIVYKGKRYPSLRYASFILGITRYIIKKECTYV